MSVNTYPLVFSGKSQRLINENNYFQKTGGVSQGNRKYNFFPAFLDFESGEIYISSFSNGNPAPIHIYDGLPKHLIVSRNAANKAVEIKQSVVSGFVHEDRFYTREQAMNIVTKIEEEHWNYAFESQFKIQIPHCNRISIIQN